MDCNFTTKNLYYVSILEMKDFFNKQGYKAKECYISTSNEDNRFIFSFNYQEEVMSYWKNKNINEGFANLTLIFEL